MHASCEGGQGEAGETHYRACESFSRAEGRGASGKAPVELHEALLQPLQFAGVDCPTTHIARTPRTMQTVRYGERVKRLIGRTVGPPLHVFHKL